MSHIPQHDKHYDAKSLFADQWDLIVNKNTVAIKLSNFPPNFTIEVILEALAQVLDNLSPPGYIEQLCLSDNRLTHLPNAIGLILSPKLRVVDLHNNLLTSFPLILSQCSNLESLNLAQNSIKFIRLKEFVELLSLRYLLLRDNKISFTTPSLCDILSLETIVLTGNPLILPPIEFYESISSTNELKSYLFNNRVALDQHIDSQAHVISKQISPSTPSFVRTRSLSDTRSKSLKASRRMGLIINSSKVTPDGTLSSAGGVSIDSITPSKPERKLLLPNEKLDYSNDDERDTNSHIEFSKLQIGTAGSGNSKTIDSSLTSKVPEFVRNRANTYREEHVGEAREFFDGDHKLNTFSRRLSTLQERPNDELARVQQRDRHTEVPRSEQESKSTPDRAAAFDISPSKMSKATSLASANGLQTQLSPPSNVSTYNFRNSLATMTIGKKLIHCLYEFRRVLARFSSERQPSSPVLVKLNSFNTEINLIQDKISLCESSDDSSTSLTFLIHGCTNLLRQLISLFAENSKTLGVNSQIFDLRAIYLSLYGVVCELQNTYKLTMSTSKALSTIGKGINVASPNLQDLRAKSSLTQPQKDLSTETFVSDNEVDNRLLRALEFSAKDAHIVLKELTTTISSLLSLNLMMAPTMTPTLTTRCKDLSSVCSATVEINRRLAINLSNFRTQQTIQTKKLLWDDINAFLKAILQIFAAVKGIMNEAPVLNDVRQSMANLTKSTKEVTILLEASSFKTKTELSTSSLSSNLSLLGNASLNQGQLSNLIFTSSVNLQQLFNPISSVRTPSASNHTPSSNTGDIFAHDGTRSTLNIASGGVTQQSSIQQNAGPLMPTLEPGIASSAFPVDQQASKAVNPFERM
ncbi:hypothetical protein PUMCH_003963 [Australozyma saopauloensis]|uniref:Leucine-rich repeat-containing protein SOG2 n=1 Tax=Australozyma saopauloensis TaxID=291208 RepID=A0AAX4HDI5_9ASCO|nr:hypothetical protein PUMCH_003963 [[Candida] saopauloensis]